jgi:glutamine synthetase
MDFGRDQWGSDCAAIILHGAMHDRDDKAAWDMDAPRAAPRHAGAEMALVAICDLAGQLRGKWVAPDKLAAMRAQGVPFPPIFPVTDFADVVLPVRATDALDRLGDGRARALPETQRQIRLPPCGPAELLLAEMCGAEAALDPRVLCRGIIERAAGAGLVPRAALEYEFTLLRESRAIAHARRFRDLAPATTRSDLYGVWRDWPLAEFQEDLRAALQVAGIAVEAMHAEFGAGCREVILGNAPGIRAADDAVIFRTLARAFAAHHGMQATFMARWSGDAPGNSGHIHVSLDDRHGAPVFPAPDAAQGLSRAGRAFVGGLQRFLPEMLLMLLPNVNSYRRLASAAWSFDPRWCLWGVDNRTAAIRLMPGDADSMHVEVRIPGADANPYLALAAVLGAGLRGIELSLEPTDPVTGNAGESSRAWPDALRLPQTMVEAIDRFAASMLVCELFGAEFQRVFAETRRAQERESRDAVSEWELRRFLE